MSVLVDQILNVKNQQGKRSGTAVLVFWINRLLEFIRMAVFLYMKDSKPNINTLRHSAEHVLAQAMLRLFPKIKMAMGPAIADGFYFDFDPNGETISELDFSVIETEMNKIIEDDLPIKKLEINEKEARKLFINNEYKQEWIDEITQKNEGGKKNRISVYWTGDKFVDLCAGPHLTSTGHIGPFKLLSIAGAYWRGSEKNKMLTRIYGTAFYSKEELDEYLKRLEEAKNIDHRKIGKDLELFTISEDVGPGLILWLPKGNIIKEELESWAKSVEAEWGYQRVTTPEITKSGLYYTSGHLPYYKDDMYPPMKLDDGEEYFLKPMNCPHHHTIYASKKRSYKELPLRLAEYGRCYRYESSGELFGLMRVRGFAQNDAHIYCTEEQAVDEFIRVMELHKYFYSALGITNYYLELSLRDPKNKKKYHGDEDMWIKAENLMRKAVAKIGIKMTEKIGGAAFYGPKIDFIIQSSIGREFAISTNQIDLFMGMQFKLKYTAKNGAESTPVIIHRAPLGSHERFIGFLIEHYRGNFPTWLTPVQAKVLPISEKNLNYAQKIADELKSHQIRAEVDDRNKALGAKIRDAQMEKTAYMLIVGEKEEKGSKITVRGRDQKDHGLLNLDSFLKNLKNEIENKTIN